MIASFKQAKRIVANHYVVDTTSCRKLAEYCQPGESKRDQIMKEAERISGMRKTLGIDADDSQTRSDRIDKRRSADIEGNRRAMRFRR